MLPVANRMTENIYPGENYHLQRRRHATGSKPKYHSYLSARRVGGRGSANGTEIVSVGMPHGKRGIVLRISTSVENFDLNERQRNFLFPLQIISPRPVSASDIYPVPIAEKHMY